MSSLDAATAGSAGGFATDRDFAVVWFRSSLTLALRLASDARVGAAR